jgi:caffeic acid 3-O-methyltransferase
VLLATDRVYLEAYQHVNEYVMESCYTFNKAHGMSPWEYVGKNPQTNRIFNEAMATHSSVVMSYATVKMYGDGFKNIKSLEDVGGGTGSSLSMIVQEHPHICGINLDLPHVIATTPPIPGMLYNVHHHHT